LSLINNIKALKGTQSIDPKEKFTGLIISSSTTGLVVAVKFIVLRICGKSHVMSRALAK